MWVWINRKDQEPDKKDRIIVWQEGCTWVEDGPVVVSWDYDSWVDVADDCEIEFVYWHLAPGSPYTKRPARIDTYLGPVKTNRQEMEFKIA